MIDNNLYAFICGPVSFCAFSLNIILFMCLCSPAAGLSLRQPLWLLLWETVLNAAIQHFFIPIIALFNFLNVSYILLVELKAVVYITYSTFFLLNAWVSVFLLLKSSSLSPGWICLDENVCIVCHGYISDQIMITITSVLSPGTISYLVPEESSWMGRQLHQKEALPFTPEIFATWFTWCA